jgi:hypothetical protein
MASCLSRCPFYVGHCDFGDRLFLSVSAQTWVKQVPIGHAGSCHLPEQMSITLPSTSGHLIRAALATLAGPGQCALVSCVISIQALIFQDGGLLVLVPTS